MTYNPFRLACQRALADLLRRLDAPRVGHRLPVGPFDPKVELSERACRCLLASGSVVRRRP